MRFALDVIYLIAGGYGVWFGGINAILCAKHGHLSGALAFGFIMVACMALMMASLNEIRYSFEQFEKNE